MSRVGRSSLVAVMLALATALVLTRPARPEEMADLVALLQSLGRGR